MQNQPSRKRIALDEEAVGKTLADNVYNRHGIMLISKDRIITGSLLEKLKDYGVMEVFVYDE